VEDLRRQIEELQREIDSIKKSEWVVYAPTQFL
jgi:hypothetical protein